MNMNKLLTAFIISKSDKNRVRLQAYIYKHPFSVCMLTPVEQTYLKAFGFKL